jgi:hypothetical protein
MGFHDGRPFRPSEAIYLPIMGVYYNEILDLENGHLGTPRVTKQRALWVNLRDSDGNEITSLGGGGVASAVKLKNIVGTEINPATSSDIASVVSAIGGIVIPAPEGGATEETLLSVDTHIQAVETAIGNIPVPPSAITGFALEETLHSVDDGVYAIEQKITKCDTDDVTVTSLPDLTITAMPSVDVSPRKTTTIMYGGVTVSTTAASLLPANTLTLDWVEITNNGPGMLYVGYSNAVTTSGATMGQRVLPGGSFSRDSLLLPVDYSGVPHLYGIYSEVAASQNVAFAVGGTFSD